MIQKPLSRVVSGMRPTGRLHLGHYFGVLKNFLEFQKKYDCFFMVADYHALTTGDLSKKNLSFDTREMVMDWLSVGIDPSQATIFLQSAVPEHAELFLILSMYSPLGWLERNPTYKEQQSELGEKWTNSLGFLGYPVLQTVDICLYKASLVPVGEDQKPHLELGRELVRRFNHTCKRNVLQEFDAILTPTPKFVGTDGRKMSKSYGNAIDICEEPDSVRKKVSKMLTDVKRPRKEDPGHPEECPVFSYHGLFTEAHRVLEIEKECRAATLTCGDDKMALAENIIQWQEPFLKRRKEIEKNKTLVDETLKRGNEKAREIALQTLREVKEAIRVGW